MAAIPSTQSNSFLTAIQALTDKVKADPNGADARFATYLQADPRYMENVESSLQNSGLPDSVQDSVRRISQVSHDAAVTATKYTPADADMKSKVDEFYQDASRKPAAAPTTVEYTVKEGDSLSKIARDQYGITDPKRMYEKALELARENGIENPDLIRTGQKLSLPGVAKPTPTLSAAGGTISGTTAGGQSVNTVLSSDWTRALAQGTPSLLLDPNLNASIGNGSTLTDAKIGGMPVIGTLRDAWSLGGTFTPDYLRTPTPADAIASVDTSQPGWFARSAQINGL